jgi:ubiquinone/menaquinone biosynthesis C-methylase UbiE
MDKRISHIGVEALDTPQCNPELARATLKDIARSNTLFGGRAAVWYGIRQLLNGEEHPSDLTVLDVGAGMGDILRYVAGRLGSRTGLLPIAVDRHSEAGRLCKQSSLRSVVADGCSLPFRSRSVDVVIASQLLHHFARDAAMLLIGEFVRIARLGVVISDLERARLAALGIWLVSFPLLFHPVSRRDGVVSIRRGFTADELASLLTAAGVRAVVCRRPGYRLVATWRATDANA